MIIIDINFDKMRGSREEKAYNLQSKGFDRDLQVEGDSERRKKRIFCPSGRSGRDAQG
jgi:hypothetical protein